MAKRIGKGGIIGSAAVLALVMVLGWAWHDGGERPLTRIEAPALLPRIAS